MNVNSTYPNLQIKGKQPQEWASLYIAGTRPPQAVTPDDHGILNEEPSFCAVAAAFHKDMTYVSRLVSHVPSVLDFEGGRWEYCYGRAGFLYLLRLVRVWYPESYETVQPAIESIITSILENGPPWLFKRGEEYWDMLGLGHGSMGILVQIILCEPKYAARLEGLLSDILNAQTEEGSWPRRWPGPDIDESKPDLVQWCHGAPGMVQGLVAIREHFPNLWTRIDDAIRRGREVTWKRGVLTKEPNLCHGTTGNAFAFPPGEKRDHFLAHTTEEKIREGYRDGLLVSCHYGIKWSLGFGGLGRVVGWLWKDREARCYLGFDDI